MPEQKANSRYSIEVDTATGQEALLPNARPGEFLPQWLKALKKGELDWFAKQPDPKLLLNGVYVFPSYRTDNDFSVSLPWIQPDLAQAIVPAVGISHCYGSSVLHGEVILLLPRPADIDRQDIKDVLTVLNATPSIDDVSTANRSQPIIKGSEMPCDPIQTVHGGGYLLDIIDMPVKDEFLGFFDPTFRKTTTSLVFLLRQGGILTPIHDDEGVDLTPYQQRCLDSGKPPLEADSLAEDDFVQWCLEKSFKDSGFEEEGSLAQRLKKYYDIHPEVEKMFDRFPKMSVTVDLSTQVHQVSTDTIMDFADFFPRINRLVPQADIPRIPQDAQRLKDIAHIENMSLISDSGQRLTLFLSRSSGLCNEHFKS